MHGSIIHTHVNNQYVHSLILHIFFSYFIFIIFTTMFIYLIILPENIPNLWESNKYIKVSVVSSYLAKMFPNKIHQVTQFHRERITKILKSASSILHATVIKIFIKKFVNFYLVSPTYTLLLECVSTILTLVLVEECSYRNKYLWLK